MFRLFICSARFGCCIAGMVVALITFIVGVDWGIFTIGPCPPWITKNFAYGQKCINTHFLQPFFEILCANMQKNHLNCCYKMSDFKTKMHQIWLQLGSLQALPRPPLLYLRGPTRKGRRGKGKEGWSAGKGDRRKGKGGRREAEGCPPSYS